MSSIPSSAVNVADITRVRLKYFTNLSNFTASVDYYANVFRVNSVYDPDYTQVGAQPSGFDQWASFYKQYRVLGLKVKIDINSTADNKMPAIVYGAWPSTSANGETAIGDALVKNRCRYAHASWASTAGKGVHVKTEPHAIMGRTLSQYRDDPNTASLVSANPTTPCYLIVFAFNQNGTWSASAASNPTLFVQMTYDVEFFDRVDLDESFRLIRELQLSFPSGITAKEIKNAVLYTRKLKTLESDLTPIGAPDLVEDVKASLNKNMKF